MNHHRHRPSRSGKSQLLGLVGFTLGLAATTGCTEPPVDDNAPPPRGVITGSVTYLGRPIDCERDAMSGALLRPKGRILMTLVDDANPLPPEGTAQTPVDFFAIGGEDVFTNLATDCLDADPATPDQFTVVNRTVDFRWSSIPLGRSYRIQAFYDQEGDFNPLFSVRQSTSAGDVAGGALENPLGSSKFEVIAFPTAAEAPNGFVNAGVNVMLAASVLTDAPLMRVRDGDLSSQQIPGFPPVAIFLPPFDLTLYGDPMRPQFPDDPLRPALDRTLAEMGMSEQVQFANPLAYAWYVDPMDVDNDGNTDCTAGDADCHPVLGAFGVQWKSPVVLLQRYRNAIERMANVPVVALIPASGNDTAMDPRVQYPDIRTRVMPFAAVITNPADSSCTSLFFANGTNGAIVTLARAALETHNTLECSELPTGVYSVNVLGGLAVTSSDAVQPEADTAISETGYVVNGGRFGSQLWTIPNEFGDFRQLGDVPASNVNLPEAFECTPTNPTTAAYCLPEQSLRGGFVVRDPDTANAYSRRYSGAAPATCTAYDFSMDTWNRDDPGTPSPDQGPDHELCCGPILHLCQVPLCPYTQITQSWSDEPEEMGMNVRSSPTSYVMDAAGNVVPNCIPFAMPAQCCGAANQPE